MIVDPPMTTIVNDVKSIIINNDKEIESKNLTDDVNASKKPPIVEKKDKAKKERNKMYHKYCVLYMTSFSFSTKY